MPGVTPSPLIQWSSDGQNWLAPGAPITGLASNATVYGRLASTAGVTSVVYTVTATDETSSAAALTASIVTSSYNGVKTGQFTLTTGADNSAGILQVLINGGRVGPPNAQPGQDVIDYSKTQTTTKFAVGPALVGCFGEQLETDPAFGWCKLINAALRASLVNPVDVNPTDNTIPIRDGNGQLRATSFATASTNVASTGALKLQAGNQIAAAIKGATHASVPLVSSTNSGATLALGDGVEITVIDLLGATVTDIQQMYFEATAGAPFIGQSQLGNIGGAAGLAMTIQAQSGQSQLGTGNDNNPGGTLFLRGGSAGTGGSGAAGTQGTVEIDGGGYSMTVSTLGITLSAVDVFWASGIAGPTLGQYQL